MIREELTTIAPHSKILFDLGHSRDKGPISRSQIEAALATGLFSAIDLYGDELSAPASAFKEFFEIARSNGLRLKIHVGENQGPAAIREEIREVQPDAIQHGFRAAEDTELMAELADSGTPLNLTLASNIMTGVVDSYEDHPIRKLFDAGVRITLGSDDFGAFGRSISDEYHELYARKIFSSSELEKIRCFGLGFCATKN
jgi:adenosine deaminase